VRVIAISRSMGVVSFNVGDSLYGPAASETLGIPRFVRLQLTVPDRSESRNSVGLSTRGEDGEIATPVPRACCMAFWEEPILAEIRGRACEEGDFVFLGGRMTARSEREHCRA
jgi:hypothetical protein